jgi:hypothetical protein
MRISQNGRSFDTLPLAGSRTAVTALAKCLAERWSKSDSPQPDATDAEPEQPDASGPIAI